MSRLFPAAIVVSAALFGCMPSGISTPVPGPASLATGRSAAIAAMRGDFLSAVSRDTRIDLYLRLAGRHDDQLDAVASSIADARAPLSAHPLTPEAFGRSFGADPAQYARAIALLRERGFVIDDLPANRTDIAVHAPAATVEAFFQTPLDLRSERGRTFFTNRFDPIVPPQLHLFAVSGLDDYGVHHPLGRRAPDVLIGGYFSWGPQDVAAAYDLAPLYKANLDGSGVTIANATCGAAAASDLAIFQQQFSLPAARLVSTSEPKDKALSASCGSGRNSYDNGESTLDADWSLAIARKATLHQVVAHGPSNHDFDLAYSYIINHLGKTIHVVTTSWGTCERDIQHTQSFRIDEKLLAQAVVEGQYWFAAAGDNGTDDCEDGGRAASVDYPGSSPYVTDVGGTDVQATIRNGNVTAWKNETVWQRSDSNGATGGGRSIIFSKPSYQKGVTPEDRVRDVPDVALIADDVNDGLWIVQNGFLRGGWGGTSEAAPQWAGLFAIIEQRLGKKAFVEPHRRLYQLAASHDYHNLFHDIVKGNNGVTDGYGTFPGFNAGPGFDLCTGWGSFIGLALVNAY